MKTLLKPLKLLVPLLFSLPFGFDWAVAATSAESCEEVFESFQKNRLVIHETTKIRMPFRELLSHSMRQQMRTIEFQSGVPRMANGEFINLSVAQLVVEQNFFDPLAEIRLWILAPGYFGEFSVAEQTLLESDGPLKLQHEIWAVSGMVKADVYFSVKNQMGLVVTAYEGMTPTAFKLVDLRNGQILENISFSASTRSTELIQYYDALINTDWYVPGLLRRFRFNQQHILTAL